MKATFIAAAILSIITTAAHAQINPPKPAEPFKLPPVAPLDTTITWHMPKTPDAIKQIPLDKFYNKPTVPIPGNEVVATWVSPNTTLLMHSKMPVAHINGKQKMPTYHPTQNDAQMVKKVIVQ